MSRAQDIAVTVNDWQDVALFAAAFAFGGLVNTAWTMAAEALGDMREARRQQREEGVTDGQR